MPQTPLIFENAYQSVRMPNNSISYGAFDSIAWFEAIKQRVDFTNKSVLDLGACQFSYGVEAIKNGASSVVGIDTDELRVTQSQRVIDRWGFKNAEMIHADVESYVPKHFNVCIFSMIIHWFSKPIETIKKYAASCDELVFVYRYPQEGVVETGFRPTIDELDKIMGRVNSGSIKISSTAAQNIMMVHYSQLQNPVNLHRFEVRDGLVYKKNPERLNADWKMKMEKILKVWKLPAFVGFCDGGYITKFIEGVDIHGSAPFTRTKSDYKTELTPKQKFKIFDIFKCAVLAGERCGYTLADINCSNILVAANSDLFLIDYDLIVEWPLPEENFKVWSNTLNIIFEKF